VSRVKKELECFLGHSFFFILRETTTFNMPLGRTNLIIKNNKYKKTTRERNQNKLEKQYF
jgi:hypothetical protein